MSTPYSQTGFVDPWPDEGPSDPGGEDDFDIVEELIEEFGG